MCGGAGLRFQGWSPPLITLPIVHSHRHRGAARQVLVVRHVVVLGIGAKLPVVIASVAAISVLLPVDPEGHHPTSLKLGRRHGRPSCRVVVEVEGGQTGQVAPVGAGNHREVGVEEGI